MVVDKEVGCVFWVKYLWFVKFVFKLNDEFKGECLYLDI